MNATERRATAGLAMVYGLRMLGLFMILPVFAVYAQGLPGPPPGWQIGLAIGIYGLSQALLQMPLGMLSDRIGRKPVIIVGMLVFALGSLMAGLAEDMAGIIAGRALQGAGAISAAVSALLADVTRDAVRTKAMAILGAGMGAAFTLALVLGPLVAGWVGVSGIFLLTALLAICALPLISHGIPAAPLQSVARGSLRQTLADTQLLRMNAGIFLLHALLTAWFVAAPVALQASLGMGTDEHWKLYLPILLASLLAVFPLIRWAEGSAGRLRLSMLAAITVLLGASLLAAVGQALALPLVAAVLLFFVGFNYLEATLPSLISRMAPPDRKGAALGAYATAQFLGAFAGGMLGGIGLQLWGVAGVFAASATLPLIWFLFAIGLRPPAPAGQQREDVQWRAVSTK